MWDQADMQRAELRHPLDTKDNRDALRAAIAAGDDVEFSTTGLTLWRVEAGGDGYDPTELAKALRIDLKED